MMGTMKYRKKPVVIESITWDGTNAGEIKEFVGNRDNGEQGFLLPDEITGVAEHALVWADPERSWVSAPVGHYIIKGIKGEFYPCAPDIFEATYETA